MPHAPQLLGSVARLWHAPLHKVSAAGQVLTVTVAVTVTVVTGVGTVMVVAVMPQHEHALL